MGLAVSSADGIQQKCSMKPQIFIPLKITVFWNKTQLALWIGIKARNTGISLRVFLISRGNKTNWLKKYFLKNPAISLTSILGDFCPLFLQRNLCPEKYSLPWTTNLGILSALVWAESKYNAYNTLRSLGALQVTLASMAKGETLPCIPAVARKPLEKAVNIAGSTFLTTTYTHSKKIGFWHI